MGMKRRWSGSPVRRGRRASGSDSTLLSSPGWTMSSSPRWCANTVLDELLAAQGMNDGRLELAR